MDGDPDEIVQLLAGHTDAVWAVAWSPDGTRLATASCFSDDDTVRVWDPRSGHLITTLTSDDWIDGVRTVAWSPDGTLLAATGSFSETVQVWDPAHGCLVSELTGHTSYLLTVAWSPDGTRLAGGSDADEVRVWEVASGHTITALHHVGWTWAPVWSPDGTRIATSDEVNEEVRVSDPDGGHTIVTITETTDIAHAALFAVQWSPDGTRIATGTSKGTVRVSDATDGHLITTITPGTKETRVAKVAWSPDGARLATWGANMVRVWDPSSGDLITTVTTDAVWATRLVWSPDGTRLATWGSDGVRIFALDPAGRSTRLHAEHIRCLDWSSAGIAVGGDWGAAILDAT